MAFKIVQADITSLSVDVIVNPTDRHYSGGGGVDYRIHHLCGKRLWEATNALPYLHLGEAKSTEGFALPCKFIIHTSGPKWYDSHKLEIEILGSCYRNSVQLAHSLGCKSIAFPLISSKGKFFPKEVALKTAIDAILECLLEYPDMEIILTVYGKWIENLPRGFFSGLADQIQNVYEPDWQKQIVAEQSATGSFSIDNLISHPTQAQLDKIPVDETFAQMLNRLIEENKTKLCISGNYISIGGDCDTTAAICGAVSQAVYGIPKELETQIRSYLDEDQLAIVDSFNERFILPCGRC